LTKHIKYAIILCSLTRERKTQEKEKAMKMKSLVIILCAAAIVFVSGCASYKNMSGEELNTSASDTPIFTATFVNKSLQPIFVDFKDGSRDLRMNFRQINPGESLSFKSKTYKKVKYTIAWWHEYGFGSEERHVKLERTGMYTGSPVVIDELFLRNKMLQSGVVVNCTPEPIKVWDSQGTKYGIIQPGEASAVTMLIPTQTIFHWAPTENKWRLQHTTKNVTINIDQMDNQYWNGSAIGWKVQILRSR